MSDTQQTICLCMIVKNESHVIRRCLDSVRPLLTTWVIIDTGSTDGTQQVIRDHLQDLPGELFERPWIDFAHNRSESLTLARGRAEYVLIIDADEVLEFESDFRLPVLDADSYLFPMRSGGLAYYKTQLVRDDLEWRFIGVVHEYIFSDRASHHKLIEGMHTLRIPDGARSRDPLTFRRDALLLEDALLREPDNTRHMFYLAQSYADANEPLLAINRYIRRASMGGWAEEAWYSLYRVAGLKKHLNAPWPEVMSDYLAAYNLYPKRAEPLFHIGYYYQAAKQYQLAYLFLAQAMEVPFPKTDLLYVEHQVYEVLLPVEYSVASYYIGRHREAIETANHMLANLALTQELVEKLVLNRSFSLEAVYGKREPVSQNSSRIVVCIVLEAGELLSPECVKSIQAQNYEWFRVVVVSSEQQEAVLESGEFIWKQRTDGASWSACLRAVAAGLDADDILLVLGGEDELFAAMSLSQVATHFASYGCELMYGQFVWGDGRRGNATPLASAEELESHAWDDRPIVPLAVRCGLVTAGKFETPLDLLRRAGFERIRFNDETVVRRRQ